MWPRPTTIYLTPNCAKILHTSWALIWSSRENKALSSLAFPHTRRNPCYKKIKYISRKNVDHCIDVAQTLRHHLGSDIEINKKAREHWKYTKRYRNYWHQGKSWRWIIFTLRLSLLIFEVQTILALFFVGEHISWHPTSIPSKTIYTGITHLVLYICNKYILQYKTLSRIDPVSGNDR